MKISDETAVEDIKLEDASTENFAIDPTEYLDARMEEDSQDDSIELDEMVDTRPEWVEDTTVPPGYKRRIFDNNIAISPLGIPAVLGPDGTQYRSRVSALRTLIRRKASKHDINEMLCCLKFEGWKSHELLATNRWRYRKHQREDHKTRVELMSEKSEIFKSNKDALKYVKNNFSKAKYIQLESFIDLMCVEMRLQSYNWVEDDSVPRGWKIRMVEGKKAQRLFILSPDGKSFQTRTAACQHMVRENFEDDEIDQMKLKMVEHERWEYSARVPFGWLLKENTGSKYQVSFMSREGEILESFLKANEYVKLHEGYSKLDLDLLQQLSEDISNENRIKGYQWVESNDLPKGWRFRSHIGKVERDFILSPEGKQFLCRRLAYMSMFEDDYSKEDIEIMRKFLIQEGWVCHKMLPNDNWLMSRKSDGLFLSDCGKMFKSFKQASEFIKQNCTETECGTFDSLFDMETVRKRTVRYTWSQDSTVPNGWLTRETRGKRGALLFLLSPDGEQFKSRRLALTSLIKDAADKDEIENMRAMIHHEGYERNSLLPANWFYRDVSDTAYHIYTETGDLYDSFSSVKEFMNTMDFSEDQISNMEKFEKEKLKSRKINEIASKGWECDDRLPEGFKVRVHQGKIQKAFYLARDGSQFPSAKLLLIHMLEKEYHENEVRKVKDLMCEEDGYEESDLLPSHWIMKYVVTKFKNDMGLQVTLISNTGKIFKSFVTAIEMMKASQKYTESNILRLKQLMDEKTSFRRQSSIHWQMPDSLPPGWKQRAPAGSKKEFFLSPRGHQFQSRKLALIHMIQEKYPEEYIELMRKSMHCEGFETNELFPAKWIVRYRFTASLDLTVISDEGNVFHSFSLVIDTIKDNKKYSQKDIDNIIKYIEIKRMARKKSSKIEPKIESKLYSQFEPKIESKLYSKFEPMKELRAEVKREPSTRHPKRMSNSINTTKVWSKVSSVPGSWSVLEAGNSKFFRDSEGRIFKSRRLALAHMISNQAKAGDIKRMREGLGGEGWSSSSLLPPDWWYKVSKDERQQMEVITEDGGLLTDLKTIKGFIKEIHSSYNRKFGLFLKTVLKN